MPRLISPVSLSAAAAPQCRRAPLPVRRRRCWSARSLLFLISPSLPPPPPPPLSRRRSLTFAAWGERWRREGSVVCKSGGHEIWARWRSGSGLPLRLVKDGGISTILFPSAATDKRTRICLKSRLIPPDFRGISTSGLFQLLKLME